jgi:hypothetical protein
MVRCVTGEKNALHLLTVDTLRNALLMGFAVRLNALMIHSVTPPNNIVYLVLVVQHQNVCQKIINASHWEKATTALVVSVII